MIRLMLTMIALLAMAGTVAADEAKLVDNCSLSYTLPSGQWQASTDPPEAAIDAMVEEMEEDAASKGRTVDPDKLRQTAARNLRSNELFIFNPASTAWLMVDVSPLEPKEEAPTPAMVETSLEYSRQELAATADEGTFKGELASAEVSGLLFASRLDATYLKDGKPDNFIGIIGFANPYWVYLFYNGSGNPTENAEMEKMLAGIELSCR